MKKAVLILLIIAASLTVIGGVLVVVAFGMAGNDWKSFGTEHFEKKTVSFSELENGDRIKAFDLNSVSDDLSILPAEGSEGRIEYYESEKYGYEIKTEKKDGNVCLCLNYVQKLPWYQSMFSFVNIISEETPVTVYLPKGEYESLKLNGTSSDLKISEGYSFTSMDVTTVSGEVSLARTDIAGKTYIRTTSGDIEAELTVSDDMEVYTTSGDIRLDNTLISGDLNLETTSGEVSLRDFDCAAAKIKTVSGNVSGRFITPKSYITDTVSGEVNVPKNDGAECSIHTVSGDISFEREIFDN